MSAPHRGRRSSPWLSLATGHRIENPEGLIAIYERPTSGSEETFYFTKDHLGSIDSVTDSAGSVEVRLSYDAFGARRDESDWSGPLLSGDWTAIASSTRRGYTEHEALDNLGLVHMNGRVHDPAIGRFISADPFVTDPLSRQSFSRYSYVINNPLTLTDPSGFTFEFDTQFEDTWFNPNFNPFSPVPQDVGNYGFAPNSAPAPNPVAEEPAPEGASVKCASKPCDDEYHETGSDVEAREEIKRLQWILSVGTRYTYEELVLLITSRVELELLSDFLGQRGLDRLEMPITLDNDLEAIVVLRPTPEDSAAHRRLLGRIGGSRYGLDGSAAVVLQWQENRNPKRQDGRDCLPSVLMQACPASRRLHSRGWTMKKTFPSYLGGSFIFRRPGLGATK